MTHLLVHGTLHLLGYDHETEADAGLMQAIEVAVLADLGLADPYLDWRGRVRAGPPAVREPCDRRNPCFTGG